MSASAMRRATACLRHCSRLKAIPHRRGPSKGRSAGPAPWATSPISARLTGGLGKTWEIAKNTYKPYPAGIVFHAVIDACFNLRAKLSRRIDDIASITVQGSALLLARGDRPVRNERDARVSIHHCAACALLLGAAGVPEFADATVFRPDIVSLAPEGEGGA